MALPGDVTTATVTFGPYTDASGAVALVGTKGTLFPVDPATGKRIHLVHVTTGQEIIPAGLPIVIDSDGTDSIGPVPHTDNATLSTIGFAYKVEWQVASGRRRTAPDDKMFAVPTAAGASVDYDLLDVAEAVPGVLVPVTYGHSAYDLAVIEGFVGDEAAWLESLVGPMGTTVPTGGAGGALSGTYPNPGLNESSVESIVTGSAAVKAAFVRRIEAALSILDPAYGVSTGTAATQTAAIKAALDANPGRTFFFPAGDYRLDTTLSITANNSIQLAASARIYAGAAMGTLIDYDNGLTSTLWSQDKFITGAGTIDAALLADKALAIGSVVRFTLGDGLLIKDPIKRGIYGKPAGAEIIGRNIRLWNTTTSNVTDNVAVEMDMADCHFSDVITRDFTVGIWDKGSNDWSDCHPWIGNTAQLTARYASSVAFIIGGSSTLRRPHADTYRYGFRGTMVPGYAIGYTLCTLFQPKFFCNTGNLTDALAAANPGAVFDLTTTGGDAFFTIGGEFKGHGVTAYAFVQGDTKRFAASQSRVPVGGISGIADYRRGVKITNTDFGPTPFSPTVSGHTTAGTTTYTAQSGTMEVRDGIVWYRFRVTGTFGATVAGNIRVGGFPFPPGATVVSTGHGPVTRALGASGAIGLAGVNGTSGPTVAIPQNATGGEIAVTASGAFDIWGEIAAPFTYPS